MRSRSFRLLTRQFVYAIVFPIYLVAAQRFLPLPFRINIIFRFRLFEKELLRVYWVVGDIFVIVFFFGLKWQQHFLKKCILRSQSEYDLLLDLLALLVDFGISKYCFVSCRDQPLGQFCEKT